MPATYDMDIIVSGFPGKSVCHGGLGWSTIVLLRGQGAQKGRVALIDAGSFGMRDLLIARHGEASEQQRPLRPQRERRADTDERHPDGAHPIVPARGADTGFVIEGAELFQLARSFDGDRPARVVYHSHTNGRAYFSTVDRAIAAGPAYPVQQLVIGVTLPASAAHGASRPAITEVAQFAWSEAAQEHVEIARWSAEDAP